MTPEYPANAILQPLTDGIILQPDSSLNGSTKLHIHDYTYFKHLSQHKVVFADTGRAQHSAIVLQTPKPVASPSTFDYMLIPYIFALALFTFTLVRYRRYLATFFEAVVYRFMGDKLVGDINVPIRRLLFLLDTLLVLSMAFIGVGSIRTFNMVPMNPYREFMYFIVIVLGYIAYRVYVFAVDRAILGVVYNKKFVERLHFDSLLVCRLAGLVLVPLSFAIHYASPSFGLVLNYIVIVAIACVLMYRLVRIVFLFLHNGVPFLYFILYLCALEIIPALTIIKLV